MFPNVCAILVEFACVSKMVLHMAYQALHRRKNFRFYHNFSGRRCNETPQVWLSCNALCVCLWMWPYLIHSPIHDPRNRVRAPQGIARKAHPLNRARWILYITRLRLVSMKAKISSFLGEFFRNAVSGDFECWSFCLRKCVTLCDCFVLSLRLNGSVQKRHRKYRMWNKKVCVCVYWIPDC